MDIIRSRVRENGVCEGKIVNISTVDSSGAAVDIDLTEDSAEVRKMRRKGRLHYGLSHLEK